MRKKTGIMFVIMGAVLLAAALLSMLYNEHRDKRAGESSRVMLDELRLMIAERKDISVKGETFYDTSATETEAASQAVTEEPQTENVPFEETAAAAPSAPVPIAEPAPIKINGHDCIGYLEIPSLSLSLPVMADWDYAKLDIAPCRHFGSAVNDDLVIAGHNFKRHFSYLTRLRGGESVIYTDTAGTAHYYTVTDVKHIHSDAVEAVKNSGHDLVLYTCTFIGDIRSAVFCDRAK